MITLRSGVYAESDLHYLINLIDRGECKLYGHAVCAFCESKRACEDVQRLKGAYYQVDKRTWFFRKIISFIP